MGSAAPKYLGYETALNCASSTDVPIPNRNFPMLSVGNQVAGE
jgi:hypothetical protein